MKTVYVLQPRYSCPTRNSLTWSTEKNGSIIGSKHDGWSPIEDIAFTSGDNTWLASGAPTEDSLVKLAPFWVNARGASAPLSRSHVIGCFSSRPNINVIVDEQFMTSAKQLDDNALYFLEFSNVWDVFSDAQPWDGLCYIACVNELRPTYDIARSELIRQNGVKSRFEGKYMSNGAKRTIRASSIIDAGPIWQDQYTREVFCNQDFMNLLDGIGVPEWASREYTVLDDLN
jgi:hypothetical protein